MKYKLRLQQPPNTRGFQRPRTFRVTKGNAIFPSHASDKSTSAFYLYSGRTLFNAGYSPRRRERKRERKKEHQSGYLASETAQKVSKRRNDTETWAKCWPPSIKRHSTAHQSMIKPINGVARSMKRRRRVVQRSCWWISS